MCERVCVSVWLPKGQIMTTIKGMQNSQLHVESTDHHTLSPQYLSSFIFQRWSHLYSSLFSLLLYLSQWLMNRCGWFKRSVALHDVMVSPAVTAGCWERPVQQNQIFSLVQKLLSVITSLNTSNKKEYTAHLIYISNPCDTSHAQTMISQHWQCSHQAQKETTNFCHSIFYTDF